LAGLMWHTIQCKSWIKFERKSTPRYQLGKLNTYPEPSADSSGSSHRHVDTRTTPRVRRWLDVCSQLPKLITWKAVSIHPATCGIPQSSDVDE